MATKQNIFSILFADFRSISLLKNKYIQILLALILIGLSSAGIYFGYTMYRAHRNKEAQKMLSVCLEEYVRALNGAVESWPTVELNCQLGYEQNQNSDLAPYFLSVKIEALLQQNKKDEALALLDSMMNAFSASSPLYSLYKTQKALIEIDTDDAMITQKGLDSLKALAEDKKNNNRDLALYYFGLYYWSHDQLDEAQGIWQELVDQFPASSWAQAVSIKLQQIV